MGRLNGGYELLSDEKIIAKITEKEYEMDENTSEEGPSSCVSYE